MSGDRYEPEIRRLETDWGWRVLCYPTDGFFQWNGYKVADGTAKTRKAAEELAHANADRARRGLLGHWVPAQKPEKEDE